MALQTDFVSADDNQDSLDEAMAPERRAPPHNLEAEQFLLGAIFMENELIERVSGFLKSEHFFVPAHRRIFDVCQRRIDSGQLADPVVLKGLFEQDGTLDQLGGEDYLREIAQSVPSLAHVRDYGRAVFETYQRRGLIRVGDEIVANAFAEDVDSDARTQIENAEASLYELAEVGRYGGGFKSFIEAATLAIENAEAAQKTGKGVSGVTTGLNHLDLRLGGLQKSDLIILAARPAMGKTSLATNIAFAAARHYKEALERTGNADDTNGAVVAFFSLEMSAEQLAQRIISGETGVPSDRVRRGDIAIEDFDALAREVQRLQTLPIHIDDQGGLSISALAARARRLKRSFGLGLIVVDYLQLVTPSGRRRSENRVQDITEITQGLKALAKELNVPVIALSQLSRAVESREDKRPMLSDLRESGSIEQDADIVIFLYRDSYYLSLNEPPVGTPEHDEWAAKNERAGNKSEIIIAKQRHGPTGTVEVAFDGASTKFVDLADDRYDSMMHE